jgi:hypothetical protein
MNEMQREFRILELAFMKIEYAKTEEEKSKLEKEALSLHKKFGEKYFKLENK